MNIERTQSSITIESLLNPAPTLVQRQQNVIPTGGAQQAAGSSLQTRTDQPATAQRELRVQQQFLRQNTADLHPNRPQSASLARGTAIFNQLSQRQGRRAASLAEGTRFFKKLSDSQDLLSVAKQMRRELA